MQTGSDARANIKADDGTGHSPCLFAHVRALPAVDSEPLLLRALSNQMPLWWLTFCLPSASVVTGTGVLRADVTSSLQPWSAGPDATCCTPGGREDAPPPPVVRVDLRVRSLSLQIGKWRIGAWLEALGAFPCWIEFSLLHILKVTLTCSFCHVALSPFNPRCACALVAHVVIRLTGMRSHFGGFVITCLLICEYLSTPWAKSEEQGLVAKPWPSGPLLSVEATHVSVAPCIMDNISKATSLFLK